MTAPRMRHDESVDVIHREPSSMTEDYVGLAWYLAQAIARGEVRFDTASDELHAAATPRERESLRRAAVATERKPAASLAARLLRRSA